MSNKAHQVSPTGEDDGFASGLPSGGDAQLVAALRAGSAEARSTLFANFSPHVHRVLLRTLGPDPEISDLLHDVFVTAIERIHELKDPSKLRSWLASMAVFMARGCIRRRQRWRWFVSLPRPSEEARPASFEDNEALVSAYKVLDGMPVDERIAFSLRYMGEMNLVEAAEACHTSLATIKRRLSRAEKKFVEGAKGHPALLEWLARGSRWTP